MSNHLQLNAHKKIHKDESRRMQKQLKQRHTPMTTYNSPHVVQCSTAVSSSPPLSHAMYSKPDAFDELDANLISSLQQNSQVDRADADTSMSDNNIIKEIKSNEDVRVKSEK